MIKPSIGDAFWTILFICTLVQKKYILLTKKVKFVGKILSNTGLINRKLQ